MCEKCLFESLVKVNNMHQDGAFKKAYEQGKQWEIWLHVSLGFFGVGVGGSMQREQQDNGKFTDLTYKCKYNNDNYAVEVKCEYVGKSGVKAGGDSPLNAVADDIAKLTESNLLNINKKQFLYIGKKANFYERNVTANNAGYFTMWKKGEERKYPTQQLSSNFKLAGTRKNLTDTAHHSTNCYKKSFDDIQCYIFDDIDKPVNLKVSNLEIQQSLDVRNYTPNTPRSHSGISFPTTPVQKMEPESTPSFQNPDNISPQENLQSQSNNQQQSSQNFQINSQNPPFQNPSVFTQHQNFQSQNYYQQQSFQNPYMNPQPQHFQNQGDFNQQSNFQLQNNNKNQFDLFQKLLNLQAQQSNKNNQF